MGISIIAGEVKKKGHYQESAISLINGDLHGARSIADIVSIAKGAGLLVTTEAWVNPKAPDKVDYLVTFRAAS